MGAVAKGTIESGGKTLGIVPEPLFKHGSAQLGETVIVPDMHTRKKLMAKEVIKRKIKVIDQLLRHQNRVMHL